MEDVLSAIEEHRWPDVRAMLQDLSPVGDETLRLMAVAKLQGAPADIILSLLGPCDIVHDTRLHSAVFADAPEDTVAELLISSPGIINSQNKFGETALHHAVQWKRWQLVSFLLEQGADRALGDFRKRTPLHLALHTVVPVDAPDDVIVQLISSHNINMQDEDGSTALHNVIRRRQWELVPLLLQHRADVNQGDKWKHSPLMLAPFVGAPTDTITQLISPVNVNLQTVSGATPLHAVVLEERWELVPVLLQHGADVNLIDDRHFSPLHLASMFGAPSDTVTHLISTENINLKDEDGNTALAGAVQMKRWELVPVLLQHGADPPPGILPEPPKPLSLRRLSIATVRRHMAVMSDEAYEGLGLPHELILEVKLRDVAERIVQQQQEEQQQQQ